MLGESAFRLQKALFLLPGEAFIAVETARRDDATSSAFIPRMNPALCTRQPPEDDSAEVTAISTA